MIAFGTTIEDVVGSRFDDSINGNKAANYIFGGEGNDVFSGGEGADIFEFYGVGGTDRITDFVSGIDNIAIKESEFYIRVPWNSTVVVLPKALPKGPYQRANDIISDS